jgi:hypothetical protein
LDDEDEKKSMMENLEGKSIIELFIISRENRFYKLWLLLDVICCLISSYFYAYLAAFKEPT